LAFHLPAIALAHARQAGRLRLPRPDPERGGAGEAGGDESQEIQFALGENDIKVLTMTVHDEIVFDNQSHKLFIQK
jgi:hypothetical protein